MAIDAHRKPLLTPREVAQELGISKRSVDALIERSELPAVHLGSGQHRAHRRVPAAALQRWLAGPNAVEARTAAPDPKD